MRQNQLSTSSLIGEKWAAIFAFAVVISFIILAFSTEFYEIWCSAHHRLPVYSIANMENRYMPPSSEHWMGTDYQGRDVFWRAVAGSATAVKVGLVVGLLSAVIGTVLGLIAGFYGGWIDDVVVWLYSTFAAMPTLLFILAFALLLNRNFMSAPLMKIVNFCCWLLRSEPDTFAIYLAIGFTSWINLCKIIRAETMRIKHLPYIAAALSTGQRTAIILYRHLLPNILHLIIIYFTLAFAAAIMSEVIVSYLGIGIQSAPSWGVMIADGQERLWRGVWWEVASATGLMFLLVLALNMLGDWLRDQLDPKTHSR